MGRKLQPGLRQSLQDFLGVSAVFATVLQILALTMLVLLFVAIMSQSKNKGDRDRDTYGMLVLPSERDVDGGPSEQMPAEHYPLEEVCFAVALSISWTAFVSGLLGDLVRSSSWLYWLIPPSQRNEQKNWAWFHALFCIIVGMILVIFWKQVVMRRMAMGMSDHRDMIQVENQKGRRKLAVNMNNSGLE